MLKGNHPGKTTFTTFRAYIYNLAAVCQQSTKPTRHHLDNENLIVVDDISVAHSFDIPLKVPEPPFKVMPDLEKHWCSLDRRVSIEKFLRSQGKKHLKFHKLKPPKNIFKVSLKFGTKLVSSLEKIFKEKGYKAGNLNDCQQLVNDIEAELDRTKVAFKDIKYG
ncbi:hypothetical protein POM88_005144 [Heracleum sosnowskyi]|uniref:Uncharacterized protein n=1 Tax=Heracleum sosnowskyi TaxID=360622 RepID=A0AAD8JLD0_9APIA|nr:hypothetical protein POM88_005144 [Heracleum sosnowskyi]